MPANEIANRLAAAGWIGVEENEDNDIVLRLRSQVSCENRLLIPSDAGIDFYQYPLIIVPLDRTFSRRETTINAWTVATVQEYERITYPPAWLIEPDDSYDNDTPLVDTRVLTQPMHLDWMGPLNAPVWLPFEANADVPAGFDLDLYNAIAFLLPLSNPGGEQPITVLNSDIQFLVFQHPPVTEETLVEPVVFIQAPG